LMFDVVDVVFCFFEVFFETRSHFISQAGLKLCILLPQFSQCWDYSCVLPCLDIFCCCWFCRLNGEPHACKAGALPLETLLARDIFFKLLFCWWLIAGPFAC
jgi:hypothetical protein